MRPSRLKVLLILAAGLVLSALRVAAAAPHFWVGFDGVKSESTSGSVVRWVSVAVGSDETPRNAKPYTFAALLTVSGPNGFGCNAVKELTTKVKPPVTLPIRFQVSYVNKAGTNRTRRWEPPAATLPRVTYHLTAKLTGDIQASHSFAFEFPDGGAPACVKLN